MSAADSFLLTLFLKSGTDFKQGFNINLIRQIINLEEKELGAVIYELNEKQFIVLNEDNEENIQITSKGMDFARTVLRQENIFIIKFHTKQYLPPSEKMQFGFRYYYDLIQFGRSQINRTITVYVSDVVAQVLQLSFENGANGERILLQYAKNNLIDKIKKDTLSQSEELIIYSNELENLPRYNASVLPVTQEAEFIVEKQNQGENKKQIINQILSPETVNSESPNHLVLRLPLIQLTENEKKWLQIIYTKFLESVDVEESRTMNEYWNDVPTDFDPYKINGLLLHNANQITLYGIYHVDPDSKLFDLFNKVVFAIKDILKKGGQHDLITSDELIATIPDLQPKEISQIFKLMDSLDNFSNGFGKLGDGGFNIHLRELNVINNYRSYEGLQEYMEKYLTKIRGVPSKNDDNDSKKRVEEKQESYAVFNAKTPLRIKSREDFDAVMGVNALANDLSQIIYTLPNDKGQMLGIFGRWGRGKTFFLNQLKTILKKKASNKIEYTVLEFHAWKYQETPASWAYLYEILSRAYLGKAKWFKPGISYLWKLFLLNTKRFGALPIIALFLGILLNISIPFLVNYYFDNNKTLIFFGIIPITLLGTTAIIRKVGQDYSTKAIDLIKKYGTRNTFKANMGIQADIQEELIKLLNVWIPQKHLEERKIVLVVEDIDRCSEEKIIQNIDALRVMLEDENISKRLLIIIAVDERILKNAITVKYAKLLNAQESIFGSSEKNERELFHKKIHQLTTEYLDKLFLCAIKLGELSLTQKNEFLNELVKNDVAENNIKPITFPETDLETKTLTKNGVLNFNEQNKISISKENQTTSISSSALNENRKKESEETLEWQKLSALEIKLIFSLVDSWPHSTPRKISIFYYRYLLCKNLLLQKYATSGRKNVWQHEGEVKALLQLLLFFGQNDQGKNVVSEVENLSNDLAKKPNLPGLKNCSLKDRQDYLDLFEILEIIIAY